MRTFVSTVRQRIIYITTAAFIALMPIGPFVVTAGATSEEPEETFTYNQDTGHWDSNKWYFDPATGTYQPQAAVVPEQAVTPADDTTNEPSDASVDTTGPGSTNTTNSTDASNQNKNVDSHTSITNDLDSKSKTGDANVTSNNKAGNAKTGDASVDATVMNVIHSTVQGDTNGIARFTTDINGDVRGDITLSPADYIASKNTSASANKTDVNSSSEITNNLDASAASGNANVSNNTSAGDATTGNAHAVANVLNLINTIIAANQSFIGTINIYGNLEGDILVSPDFIPQLIADNSVCSPADSMTLNNNDTQEIVNNIQLDADTGSANVSGNTSAGGASTGTANTNLTILNLTGRKVTAENSMLVFINVLGKWVGVIVDAPEGATAAALGSGVTDSSRIADSATLNNMTNNKITNNISLAATSGDANITNNTSAGNAKTGDATASANVLNMSSSSFSLSKWFGVLFINVFGTWHGSFGVDTANGNIVPLSISTSASGAGAPAVQFGFVPTPQSRTTTAFMSAVAADQAENGMGNGMPIAATLAAADVKTTPNAQIATVAHQNPLTDPFTVTLLSVGGGLFVIGAAAELIRRRTNVIA